MITYYYGMEMMVKHIISGNHIVPWGSEAIHLCLDQLENNVKHFSDTDLHVVKQMNDKFIKHVSFRSPVHA